MISAGALHDLSLSSVASVTSAGITVSFQVVRFGCTCLWVLIKYSQSPLTSCQLDFHTLSTANVNKTSHILVYWFLHFYPVVLGRKCPHSCACSHSKVWSSASRLGKMMATFLYTIPTSQSYETFDAINGNCHDFCSPLFATSLDAYQTTAFKLRRIKFSNWKFRPPPEMPMVASEVRPRLYGLLPRSKANIGRALISEVANRVKVSSLPIFVSKTHFLS